MLLFQYIYYIILIIINERVLYVSIMFRKLFKMFGYVKRTTNLNDDARQKSIEMRELKAEMRHAKNMLELKQQIGMLQSAIAEDSGKSNNLEDELLSGLLGNLFAAKQPQEQKTKEINNNNLIAVELTEEEIRDLLSKIPKKYLKLGKKLNDETMKKLIASHLPGLGINTYNHIMEIYKSEY